MRKLLTSIAALTALQWPALGLAADDDAFDDAYDRLESVYPDENNQSPTRLILPGAAVNKLFDQHAVLIAQDPSTHIAMEGVDPVSYFDEGYPVRGSQRFQVQVGDAIFLFESDEHRQRFLSEPEHFMPMFGGFDPEELRAGRLVPADPNNWTIADDRLYLSADKRSEREFKSHQRETIRTAMVHWDDFDGYAGSEFIRAHARDGSNCTGQGSGGFILTCDDARATLIEF